MSVGNSAYSVARPTRQCAATGQPINPGETFVSTLVERPGDDDLIRLDFSVSAWNEGARPKPPLRLFGFWKTVLADAQTNANPLLDDEDLLDLFDQLGETEDDRRVAFRFVLALILIRKRLLVYEGGVPATGSTPGVLRVRRRGDKSDELTEVVDPGMDDQTVEAVTEQIGRIMNLDARPTARGDSS
ncbi:MAG: hypothetical protein D6695_01555 [Planctomycetota bacterium]|nr:MAG: hypothetical protein D6695_01555 [Planctomycetota bacterium]